MANFPSSLPSATPANHGAVVDEVRAIGTYLQGMPGRNRVINGSFRTNQRGYTSAGSLASGAYGFDRWKSTTASSSMTFTAAPQGQTVTINSGGSFAQIVERAYIEAATYTLTWSGTATGRVYNVGGSVPSYATSPVSVAVDGLADLTVEFTASGGTRTLGEVQLEVAGPSTFERVHPASELEMCKRYYSRTVFASGAFVGAGQAYATIAGICSMSVAVPMRATPTCNASAVGHFAAMSAAGGLVTATGLTFQQYSDVAVRVAVDVASGLAAGNGTLLLSSTNGAWIELAADF